MAQHYYNNGLAATARSTYAASQQRYTAFCKSINTQPTPATEQVLVLFATHLATTNIFYAAIKVYLSAIRHTHVMYIGETLILQSTTYTMSPATYPSMMYVSLDNIDYSHLL